MLRLPLNKIANPTVRPNRSFAFTEAQQVIKSNARSATCTSLRQHNKCAPVFASIGLEVLGFQRPLLATAQATPW